jgi:transposase
MHKQQEPDFAAFVGIDWSDRKHDICIWFPGQVKPERLVIEHRPEAIQGWAEEMRARFGGAPVAVSVELQEGPSVWTLLEYDFIVMFPVKPTTVARYRSAFRPSGAKVILELLMRHRDKLERLSPERSEVRQLRRLVELRRDLVHDRTRLTNRLTDALKAYFPQVLSWFRDKDAAVFADFVERWPTLQAAQRARREHCRASSTLPTCVALVPSRNASNRFSKSALFTTTKQSSSPLVCWWRHCCRSCGRLRLARFDTEIARLSEALPDYALFSDLPGAGAILAPRLLAAFGERRERFSDASAAQKCFGVAPVIERSGNKSWVHWRYGCSKFLRQTFVEWPGQTIPRCAWAKAFYEAFTARGGRHQAALRALAFKWIRILFRCWRDRIPYDEARYTKALHQRSAPAA